MNRPDLLLLSYRFVVIVALLAAAGCPDESTGSQDTDGAIAADASEEVSEDVAPGDGGLSDAVPDAVVDVSGDSPLGDSSVGSDGEGDAPNVQAGFGEPCSSNTDCLELLCVPSPAGYVCSRQCKEGCPDGWACKQVTSGGADTQYICVPEPALACTTCEADADCLGDLCQTLGDGQYCLSSCEQDGDCPSGFQCEDRTSEFDPEVTAKQCVPLSNLCRCSSLNLGLERPCAKQNDDGSCFGIETCETVDTATGEASWSSCTAAEPAPEDCDGVDNNCDGLIDNSPVPPLTPCESTNDAGTCAGAWSCESGATAWTCVAPEPEAEVCDFQDNDCDGSADEDFKNADGLYNGDTNCGGCGNDCTGKFPNATSGCVVEGGLAFCGVIDCDPGFYQASPTSCPPLADPSCAACAEDANCAVAGNACTDLDGGAFCTRDCSATNLYGVDAGVCPAGFTCTDVGNAVMQCLPDTGSCSCLSAADSGSVRACINSNADGTCTGLQTCDGVVGWGACNADIPAPEACNGLDDNCNGQVDDGLVAPTAPCEQTNAEGTCAGTWSCNPAVGFECDAVSPEAETCDYIDNNCDGVVDDPFLDAGGTLYATDEHCGVCNNSCLGLFPNATSGCDVSSGTAQCVVTACDPGYYQVAPTTCLPVSDPSCTPCVTDDNCLVPGNKCVQIDGGSFCARDCSADTLFATPGECGGGFTCGDPGDGSEVCLPDSASCTCLTLQDDTKVRPCVASNNEGTCTGFETCQFGVGWSSCSALVPAAESCDGIDNDCDGEVDDNVVEPTTACQETTSEGTCTASWQCQGSQGWVCPVATPVAETCDFADNNCDGSTDETFLDGNGLYVSSEHCGLCNNSCEGAVPFAESTDCAVENGAAVCIAVECEPGFVKPAGTDRICLPSGGVSLCTQCTDDTQCAILTDGQCEAIDGASYCTQSCTSDTDCGDPDFGCDGGRCRPASGSCTCLTPDLNDTRACFNQNADGTCLGTQTCTVSGWDTCDAQAPAAEDCNGADDNCNGLVDEGVSQTPPDCSNSNNAGVCSGLWVCGGSSGWQCNAADPAAEVCDYLDNDCDGTADEDFRDAVTGQYVDDANCGACGVDCAGALPNATAGCSMSSGNARCEVADCDPGYFEAGPLTCLPTIDVLCQPCSVDSDCPVPGDRCLALDGATYCGRDCSTTNDHGNPAGECPTGYSCDIISAGVEQCVPETGSCSCLPGDDGATRGCTSANGVGTCFGTETCSVGGGGWTGCTALVPIDEICDGVDNDCNNAIDDLPGRGGSCDIVNGFGTCVGALDCVGGNQALQCVGQTPAAESCNYSDDDCDGAVDEAFPTLFDPCNAGLGECAAVGSVECTSDGADVVCNAVAGDPGTEVCNGLDDDCDETVDEGGLWDNRGQPCTSGLGACAAVGVYVCDPTDLTLATVCNAVEGSSSPEVCDGIDNDCNAATDDGLTAPSCVEQDGVCSGSVQSCTGAGGFAACSGPEFGSQYEPVELTCDGLDNDCDGTPDNGIPASLCTNQTGVCAGSTRTCAGSSGFQTCGATEFGGNYEVDETTCDGLDNDCDGTVDEGFLSGGTYATQEHCGVCGNSCTGSIPNGTATCDGASDPPECVVASCAAGYVNVGGKQCLPTSLGLCEPCVTAATCLLPGQQCVTVTDGSFCLTPCVSGSDCPSGFSCSDPGGGNVCVPDTDACTCDGSNTTLERACSTTYSGTGGPYECFGLQNCTSAGWSSCSLPSEACNLLDDDCDGTVDEGFLDGDGRYTADEHCGTCGNNCTLLTFSGNPGVCNSVVDPPICSVACTGNCFDVNANPSDGCECCNPVSTDFPDVGGTDANCDGVDGEVDNAIFVSKDGDDANPGTRNSPKLTISNAISTASSEGKRDVYVATGIYSETVTLVAGVGVYGGYSGEFGTRNATQFEVAILQAPVNSAAPGSVNCIGVNGGSAGTTVFDGFSVFGVDEKSSATSSYAVFVRDCDDTVTISNNRIFGGSGGAGVRGDDGVDGDDGPPGGTGLDSVDFRNEFSSLNACGSCLSGESCGTAYPAGSNVCVLASHSCDDATHTRAGGGGGALTCGAVVTNGGAGGDRRCPSLINSDTTATPELDESGVAGMNGGAAAGSAGQDVYHSRFSCEGYNSFGTVQGGEGADGSNGVSGSAGVGCAAVAGTIVGDGTWQPGGATSGVSGSTGGGGGGGGSGAGAYSENSCDSKDFNDDNIGGSGGGGGAGACEGTGGTFGGGGGGAFGVLASWTSAPSTLPTLTGNVFEPGVGGDGGNGGNGGTGGGGGSGGLGGLGGGLFNPVDPTYPSFGGGKGGNGGDGGSGGGGGGGCGGSVYALFASGQGGADLSSWLSANSFNSGGTGGTGGTGGFSLGNSGTDGSSGTVTNANF